MFKEINKSIPASHRITGKFLCVSLMWDRSKYLHYLDMLLSATKNRFNIINPIVIEDSFPLNYDQQQLSDSSNSIAELRIRLISIKCGRLLNLVFCCLVYLCFDVYDR